MKTKLFLLLLLLTFVLCGCSVYDGQYTRVTPHKVSSSESKNDDYTIRDYMELREVLSAMAASGTESGIIYAEGYETEALEKAVDLAKVHLCANDPIGAYAVENIDCQIGTNSGKMALAVQITYRQTIGKPNQIRRVEDTDAASEEVMQALSNCESGVVMFVNNYVPVDFTQMVSDLAQSNPQTVMELPQVREEVYGQGSSRVVELKFSYETSRDTLRMMQNQVRPIFDASALYVSGEGSDNQKLSQLYAFLMERFEYVQETSITPTYSLLQHGVGDSRAFATVYAAMCRKAGLDCRVVTGTRWGESWTWNIVCDDGRFFHVDLLRCNDIGAFRESPDTAMSGYVWDFSAYPQCGNTDQIEEPTAGTDIG